MREMIDPIVELDEPEDEVLADEISDEALELAAGMLNCTSDTFFSRHDCTNNPCCLCR